MSLGAKGEAAGGEEEAVDEQTGCLVICGPGTLSLPWIHLSSRGVRGRGVEMEEEEEEGGGLRDRKWFTMTSIFQHFHPWPQQCARFAGDGKDRVADVM